MDIQIERCAGIDIGKDDVKVCVRTPGSRPGTRHSEVRTFSTMTRGLLAMWDWLDSERVTTVGMESTGSYWKPVFYVLEDRFDAQLLNAAHLRKVPGRKSDVSDAQWIAQMVEYGLVRPSFVPPPPIRELRDLTRYRTSLVQERSREQQRLDAVLQDAGIKLSSVASEIFGVSGRAMINALIAGERDPQVLADLAKTRLRAKLPVLQDALVGRFNDHHALLCQMMLRRVHEITTSIETLTTQIDTQMARFHVQHEHLITIPGVGHRVADIIIAETGGDMSRFPTAADLSSWAGMCPGNNESAGKHFAGTTRKGNTALRGALGEAAAAAARTRNTYLGQRYSRLARRRGKKRALVAVGRSILEAAWYVMKHDVDYKDLGADYYTTRIHDKARAAQRLISQLNQLGYPVRLPDAA